MMHKTGKVRIFLACLVLICQAFILSGCGDGNSGSETSGLQIEKEGKIIATLVEPFEKDYYSVEGLKAQIQDEISSYENAGAITLDSVEELTIEKDGQSVRSVKVVMEYATAKDYENFNGSSCFYGTVEEARNSGYAFEGTFVNTKGEKKELKLTDLAELKACKVFIVGEETMVTLPGKVYLLSEAAEQNNNCIITHGQELTYVIMK